MGSHGNSGRQRHWFRIMLTLAGIAVAVLISPPGARMVGLGLPWAPGEESCRTTAVLVAVAPQAAPIVEGALGPAQGSRLPDGRCLDLEIRSQEPLDLVNGSTVLPVTRAPQVWIPDSSLWTPQVNAWELSTAGSLAFTPLVLATSPAAVSRLGWDEHPPSWGEGLSGARPVAMPDPRTSTTALGTFLGLWQSLGKKAAANQAVAAALLSTSRAGAPSIQAAVEAAASNDPDAPLLAATEATVFNANRGADGPRLVAVYPEQGSPALDFPIIRVAPQQQDSHRSTAVDAILDRLTSDTTATLVRENGLRDSSGNGPGGPGVQDGAVTVMAMPEPTEVAAFLGRLRELQIPSRILTVMDVSLSMRTEVPGTSLSRVQLAGQAAVAAGDLLTDRSSAGLWVFALDLDGGLPHRELSQVAPLGSADDGRTHRDQLNQELSSLSTYLSGGGTALYATAVAAMKTMQRSHDADAVNSVVLFTDGTNENDPSMSLDQAVAQLTAMHDPKHPVQLIAIGIGPTADLEGLQALTAPTGGKAYRANTANQLRQVLFESLARRSPPA